MTCCHLFRRRVVHVLVFVGMVMAFHDSTFGQGRFTHPRFRQQSVVVPERIKTSQQASYLPQNSLPEPWPDTTAATPSHSAPVTKDATSRARQALWHAQNGMERHAVARTVEPRTFGYQPRHEKYEKRSSIDAAKVLATHRRVSAEVPVRPQAAQVPSAHVPSIDIQPSGVVGDSSYFPSNSDVHFNGEESQYLDPWVGETGPYDNLGGDHYYDDDSSWNDGFQDGMAYELDQCGCDAGCFNCLGSLSPAAAYALGDFSVDLGVQGFTNGINEGVSGSFGFHEGFNIGTALPFFPYSGWGFQFGLRWLQSDLDGTAQTTSQRNQIFSTIGIFKRTDWGCQAGLVVDVLDDEWVGSVNLTQVRGELSWNFGNGHELGYWFAASGDTDITTAGLVGPLNVNVTDAQAFFYRARSSVVPGATSRFMLGFSNNSNALLAAETMLPLSDRLSLLSTASYLIPDEPTGAGAAENEVWNIGMSVVFSLRGSSCAPPFAPLFRVADNGSFFVDAN